LLSSILGHDPRNADAWYLLGAAVQEPRETAYCLRQAAQFQPDHPDALEGLAHLERNFNLAPLQVMMLDASSAAVGRTCPFCQQIFCAGDRVVSCPDCRGSQHYQCWLDNGYACARRMCSGFSLREITAEPLPVQPQEPAGRMIVIRKENMSGVKKATKVEQEEPFLRRLLIMKLLAVEGQLSPEAAANLPDVDLDLLLEQYRQDRRKAEGAVDEAPDVPVVEPPVAAVDVALPVISKFCVHCGKAYLRDGSRFCAYCGKPRRI
jgi:hypothetical protein